MERKTWQGGWPTCTGASIAGDIGRNRHAWDALYVGITQKKVNWVLDLDVKSFFDKVDHDGMIRFVEHRMADRRMVRLIRKWLKAGVMEEGRWCETKDGTPQGAVISPILANLYLHHVLDIWAKVWREKVAQGDMIIVRYADDAVLGFQHRSDAERFLEQLRERMRKFGLELHPDKTRLIEFGRYAAERRKKRGGREAGDLQLFGVYPHLWAQPGAGVLHDIPQDDRQTDGRQAERYSADAAPADARVDGGYGEVAALGCSRIFPIPCRTGQRGTTEGVSQRCAAHVAATTSTAESTQPLDVGAFSGATRCHPPAGGDPAPLACCAVCRQASEVSTVCVSSARRRTEVRRGTLKRAPRPWSRHRNHPAYWQEENLNEYRRVAQSSVPLAAMYSPVYHIVQSSVGSRLMLV